MSRAWVRDAACAGTDMSLWFPDDHSVFSIRGRLPSEVIVAISICQKCPVKAECLAYAMTAGPNGGPVQHGVWGGIWFNRRSRRERLIS